MLLIRPEVQIDTVDNPVGCMKKIEVAGRVCYKSEVPNDFSYENFIKRLIARGHTSVLEHQSISVTLKCDRAVANELVRHRIASYSQESTRYCNYNKKGMEFIIPPWCWDIIDGEYVACSVRGYNSLVKEVCMTPYSRSWIFMMGCAELMYNHTLETGSTPEMSRDLLPLSLKTEIVMTTNFRAWRHFFGLRCDKTAHPQMREVANMILLKFKSLFPPVFSDIPYYDVMKKAGDASLVKRW